MASRDDNNNDDDYDWYRRDRTNAPDVSVIAERQRTMNERLRKVEKKQGEVDSLMNKGIGGMALLIGAGVFIGWLFAVGGNVLRFLKGVG
jgi:hypothetical protein